MNTKNLAVTDDFDAEQFINELEECTEWLNEANNE